MGTFNDISNVLDTVSTQEGELKTGFSGIGPLRGRQDYNDREIVVLDHLFTNHHSNIYAVTDNMPNELWAQIMGQFARTSTPARDRALKIINNSAEKYGSASVDQLAELISKGRAVEEALDVVKKRASKWVSEWGINYGHASLRDSGVIRMVFEGVSQRATKEIESAREGAYQEISTRAVPFKKEFLGIPYELQGTPLEEKMEEIDNKLIDFYQRAYDKLLTHLNDKFSHLRTEANETIKSRIGEENLGTLKEKDYTISDREWESTIKGKAFDVARYLLPQNITTALGITLNTRRFQDQLTEWQSNPIWEIRAIGKAAQIEAKKISPELMKYGNKSDYYEQLPNSIGTLANEELANIEKMPFQHYDVTSKLINASPNIEDLVLASVLFNGSDGSRSMTDIMQHVNKLSNERKREIAEATLKEKGVHDLYPKIMEVGNITFDRLYDIGAYRDLQRQRGDRQQRSRYAVVGFNMPKEFTEIGMDKEFVSIMREVKGLYDELKGTGFEFAAEYVPVMANVVRHISGKEPTQAAYEAGLRTIPAGIDSYRNIIQQEMTQTFDLMPAFKGLIDVDNNYYELGRIPETVNAKVRKAKEKIE